MNYYLLATPTQDLCTQVSVVQSQLSEAQSQISQVEELNQQLSSENSQLSREKCGLLELVKEKESGAFEQDLVHLLHVISDGVSDGVLKVNHIAPCCLSTIQYHVSSLLPLPLLKLSEVTLCSQTPPFPAKDLPLGTCDCSSTLSRYENELCVVKGELESRLKDLHALRGDLASLKAEHRETVVGLESSRNSLMEASQQERNKLESQVS